MGFIGFRFVGVLGDAGEQPPLLAAYEAVAQVEAPSGGVRGPPRPRPEAQGVIAAALWLRISERTLDSGDIPSKPRPGTLGVEMQRNPHAEFFCFEDARLRKEADTEAEDDSCIGGGDKLVQLLGLSLDTGDGEPRRPRPSGPRLSGDLRCGFSSESSESEESSEGSQK